MKIRLNPLLLGAFITGAVVIVISALLGLGAISFHPISRFVFFLPRSTAGVSEGTAVNLAGVRVGQVQQVRIYYNRDKHQEFVAVICRVSRNLLTDVDGNEIKLTDEQTLKKMVSQGLYAQIQTSGLVGAKFVELGFNATSSPTELAATPSLPYPEIPYVPSKMSKIGDNLSDIVAHLQKVDFAGIMHEVNATLVSAQNQINQLQTNRLTDHISDAAASFGQFMKSAELQKAVTHLKTAAAQFQNLVTNVNAQVQPAGTNLVATLTAARESARELQDLLTLRNQLGEQTHDLLEQLNRTARSIERLADFVQRHPNALITGRAQPQNSD